MKEKSKVKELFNEVSSKKNFDIDNVDAGRVYVASFVYFIHYVEELFSDNNDSNIHKH